MADEEITCPVCGFNNPEKTERCRACGAKLEALTANYTEEELQARRYQQESFEGRWALIAGGIYIALQAVILGILPLGLSNFDPQGLSGLMISAAVWFVGGIVVGFISPGKTFVEPAAGALIAVPPTIAYLVFTTPDGFQPSMMAYIVFSILGVMVALFGAFIGEKVQMDQA